MNRKEIKDEAKAKIKGNIWNILWPILIISVITGIVSRLFGTPEINVDVNSLEEMSNFTITTSQRIGTILTTIITGFLTAGYYKYILNFIRNGEFESNIIIDTIKEKWLNIIIAVVLVELLVGIGMALLIVPGVILSLGLAFSTTLVVDTDVKGQDSLKKSWEMMKGYKWNYFVFMLSFIGWFILVPFTLGLILIWLIPYMNVAEGLYYNKLKELKKN